MESIYLSLQIEGTEVRGDVNVPGREDTIRCLAFNYRAKSEDGAVEHGRVQFTKRSDMTTPLLFDAVYRNSAVDHAEFRFFRPSPSGQEEHFLTVKLSGGRVVDVHLARRPDAEELVDTIESVRLRFDTIEITYEDGGITTKASVVSPR